MSIIDKNKTMSEEAFQNNIFLQNLFGDNNTLLIYFLILKTHFLHIFLFFIFRILEFKFENLQKINFRNFTTKFMFPTSRN